MARRRIGSGDTHYISGPGQDGTTTGGGGDLVSLAITLAERAQRTGLEVTFYVRTLVTERLHARIESHVCDNPCSIVTVIPSTKYQ